MSSTRLLDDRALRALVRRRFLDEVGAAPSDAVASPRERLAALLREEAPLLAATRVGPLVDQLVSEVRGLGPLDAVLADPEVTEVMINGPGIAYVERSGVLGRVELDLDADEILGIVERVVGPLGLRLDRSSPIVDARLADGSRLNAVLPPLAVDGPCVTIRRFRAEPVTLEAFGAGPEVCGRLVRLVRSGWNVLVAGGTGAGKTTLLNALSSFIDPGERLVTVEETAELRLAHAHWVRLEARPANAEGAGQVTVRDLVRTALRMRPDRLLVGEVRGGEALDMLQALNTGHDGSLSTVHANGPAEALLRLETLVRFADAGLPVEAVRAQIATALDAVVMVRRGSSGARRIDSVSEVRAEPDGGPLRAHRLLVTEGGELREVARPERPPRRVGVPC